MFNFAFVSTAQGDIWLAPIGAADNITMTNEDLDEEEADGEDWY
ncbi:MAG: hypothetical protein ACRDF4_08460 [Rhabdochlamydiaceae bacterium]